MRLFRLSVTFLLLFATFSPVCLRAEDGGGMAPEEKKAAEEKKYPEPDKSLVYRTVGDVELRLNLILPEGYQPTDKRPTVVLYHGGGWAGGHPSQFYPHLRYFAKLGCLGIAPQYRIRKVNHTNPFDALTDAKCAMRYIRSHAAELGVDPQQIVAGGSSAGGHLAAALATISGFNAEGEDTTISTTPTALLLFCPVIDNGPEGYGSKEVKARHQEFSPLHNITHAMPPTLFLNGDVDQLVPVATVEKYKAACEQQGSLCKTIIYPEAKHGCFYSGKYRELGLAESETFLREIGFLK